MKLVVTVVGKDKVGIIAMVSSVLAQNNVNIISINQNIIDDFFNMKLHCYIGFNFDFKPYII